MFLIYLLYFLFFAFVVVVVIIIIIDHEELYVIFLTFSLASCNTLGPKSYSKALHLSGNKTFGFKYFNTYR